MLVTMSLTLPGEPSSVRVARRVLGSVLDACDVGQDTAYDLCLALTEACTNVVDHAHVKNGYKVVVELSDRYCRMTVTDAGSGFRPAPVDAPMLADAFYGGVPGEDEHGRGLPLIRALADRVGISSGRGEGVIIFLEKRLRDCPGLGRQPRSSGRRSAAAVDSSSSRPRRS